MLVSFLIHSLFYFHFASDILTGPQKCWYIDWFSGLDAAQGPRVSHSWSRVSEILCFSNNRCKGWNNSDNFVGTNTMKIFLKVTQVFSITPTTQLRKFCRAQLLVRKLNGCLLNITVKIWCCRKAASYMWKQYFRDGEIDRGTWEIKRLGGRGAIFLVGVTSFHTPVWELVKSCWVFHV